MLRTSERVAGVRGIRASRDAVAGEALGDRYAGHLGIEHVRIEVGAVRSHDRVRLGLDANGTEARRIA